MKSWELETYCYNMRGDRIWAPFSDHEKTILKLPRLMTFDRGVKELIRVYKYINKALHMRLRNTLTNEAIPIELLNP